MTVRTDWIDRWAISIDGKPYHCGIEGRHTTTGALADVLGRFDHDGYAKVVEVSDHHAVVDLDDEWGSLLELRREVLA